MLVATLAVWQQRLTARGAVRSHQAAQQLQTPRAESPGKNDDFRADVRTIPDPDDRGVREGASVRALGIGPAADRTIANVFNLQRFDEI